MAGKTPRHKTARGRHARKKAVRERLLARDLDGLVAWVGREKKVYATIVSYLYETDELLRWRAIEAVGRVATAIARDDLSRIRDNVRRFFWSMTEESGALGWHAPEAIGETLANVPRLIGEYGGLVLSLIREEPFERGSHWAVARITGVGPSRLTERAGELDPSLEDPDPFIRAHAALALRHMLGARAEAKIAALGGDDATFTVYDPGPGDLREVTVSGWLGGTIPGK